MLWQKTANAPLNSLVTKCLDKVSTCVNKLDHGNFNLTNIPSLIKQEILDYFTRQSKTVPVSFICKLLNGIKYVDLWTLADTGNLRPDEVEAILSSLKSSSPHSLLYLSIGGSWMFNPSASGALLSLLQQTQFPNLRELRVQQLTSEELVILFRRCPKLTSLDICQPCITDGDLVAIAPLLKCTASPNLIEICLPSSIRHEGIVTLMALFSSIKSLKVARIEAVLNSVMDNPLPQQLQKARDTLVQLESLSITHPLGPQTVSHLVITCPSLKELSLEIQEGMQLQDIAKLSLLTRLQLRNSPNSPASYLDCVFLFHKIGPHLQALSLEYFDVFDLSHIAKLCPNLTALSAQWFSLLQHNNSAIVFTSNSRGSEKNNNSDKFTPFGNLRHLRLRPRPEHKIQSRALHFILDHALNLQHCELYCCDFTEEDLKKTGKLHKLVHLRTLIIRLGHELSTPFLSQLTMSLPKLEYLACDQSEKLVKNGLEDADANEMEE